MAPSGSDSHSPPETPARELFPLRVARYARKVAEALAEVYGFLHDLLLPGEDGPDSYQEEPLEK